MKQHILPNQTLEISEQQFYSLFKEIVKRKDYPHFHNKKVTIGKCIELIKNYSWHIENNNNTYTLTLFENESNIIMEKFQNKHLIDCLWDTIKFILNQKGEFNHA